MGLDRLGTFADETLTRAAKAQLPVLLEADKLIHGDRSEAYGHPLDDYTRTANVFNALTGHKLSPLDGIIFMVIVKLSREQHSHKRDNIVDAAGYLGCFDDAIAEAQRSGINL